jgi:hypothetical protein
VWSEFGRNGFVDDQQRNVCHDLLPGGSGGDGGSDVRPRAAEEGARGPE